MTIVELRAQIKTDLFSYLELTDALSSYQNVREKITQLLRRGDIIRIKKGLYLFPEPLRRAPLNPCLIANLVYGPSYVSGDYALSWYGLIPEKVTLITSVTSGRTKRFETPVGDYVYYQRKSPDYPVGVVWMDHPEQPFLIASKEKAIYDKALSDSCFDGRNVIAWLFEDLRIDSQELTHLDGDILAQLKRVARGKMLLLIDQLEKWAK